MVLTVRVGMPSSMTVFSWSVAVGQACTQAPHETHSDSMKALVRSGADLRLEAAALDGQREGALHLVAGAHAAEQTMHLLGSKAKYGLVASFGASRWLAPSRP